MIDRDAHPVFLSTLASSLRASAAPLCCACLQCFFIVVTIIGGAVYFKELSSFDLLQFIMFPVGVLLILIGIFLLSQRNMSKLPRLRVRGFAVLFMVRANQQARLAALQAGKGRLLEYSCLCHCHVSTLVKVRVVPPIPPLPSPLLVGCMSDSIPICQTFL